MSSSHRANIIKHTLFNVFGSVIPCICDMFSYFSFLTSRFSISVQSSLVACSSMSKERYYRNYFTCAFHVRVDDSLNYPNRELSLISLYHSLFVHDV